MLSARRLDEEEDRSPEQIAKDLSKRYGGRAALHYTGDMNEIPQRLLMPSVHDASLWQVRVKVGFLFLFTMCSFFFTISTRQGASVISFSVSCAKL